MTKSEEHSAYQMVQSMVDALFPDGVLIWEETTPEIVYQISRIAVVGVSADGGMTIEYETPHHRILPVRHTVSAFAAKSFNPTVLRVSADGLYWVWFPFNVRQGVVNDL